MLNLYNLVNSPMLEELKWDSKVISAMTMTPTAYYQKVHRQISISLLKPHAAFLIVTRERLWQIRSSKLTVPVSEDLLWVCLPKQQSHKRVTNFSCTSSAWHHCMNNHRLRWMQITMPDWSCQHSALHIWGTHQRTASFMEDNSHTAVTTSNCWTTAACISSADLRKWFPFLT